MSKQKAENKIKKIQHPTELGFNKLLLLPLILINIFIYYKSLNNELTHWDDDRYITENNDIKTLQGATYNATLKKTFSTYVMGNYHPLTMLTFAWEYNKFQLNPKPYHVTNLIIHIVNTLLVFLLIWLLTQQQWVAFITSILFAIHPMHVESVAWVSERKDVLYAFFYLSSLCCYLVYVKDNKKHWLIYASIILLYVLGLLSKGMAVSLPLTLLAIDYFLGRKLNTKTVIEKVPFLLLSIVFGYIAIKAQASANTINLVNYNMLDRFLFTCYGLVIYLFKLLIPVNLSCFYGYPTQQNGMYPIIVYLSPLLIGAFVYLIYLSTKKGKDILFGSLFFISTILLVLQLLPVGNALIAERYTYLPYIGLFFIAARYVQKQLTSDHKTIAIALTCIAVLCYSFIAAKRTLVWHDSFTLWNNAIEEAKEADEAFIAYYCRGQAYHRKGEYQKAITDFDKALTLKSDYPDAYYDRGYANDALGNYNEAITDYTKSLALRPDYANAYCNRGNAYFQLKQFEPAMHDYNMALKYNPDMPGVYSNRGIIHYMFKNYDAALQDVLKARAMGHVSNEELLNFLLKQKNPQ
jgi:tetratricopeptide (TPR) repeat protein